MSTALSSNKKSEISSGSNSSYRKSSFRLRHAVVKQRRLDFKSGLPYKKKISTIYAYMLCNRIQKACKETKSAAKSGARKNFKSVYIKDMIHKMITCKVHMYFQKSKFMKCRMIWIVFYNRLTRICLVKKSNT